MFFMYLSKLKYLKLIRYARDELFRHANAFICHGRRRSIYESISAGHPIINDESIARILFFGLYFSNYSGVEKLMNDVLYNIIIDCAEMLLFRIEMRESKTRKC
jgi:hypothetical protein